MRRRAYIKPRKNQGLNIDGKQIEKFINRQKNQVKELIFQSTD